MLRTVLTVLGAFAVTALAAWCLVFFGTLAVWEVMGVADRDGGRGMGLAFGIAPLVALLAGTVGAIMAGVRVHRRGVAAAAGNGAVTAAGRPGPVAGAIAGALALYVPTRLAFWLVLGRNEYDALWKALAHAWTPTLLGVAGAVLGWRLGRRPPGQ